MCGEEYNKGFSPVKIPQGSLISRPYLTCTLYQILEVGKAWEQGYLNIGVKVTTIKKLPLCNESNCNVENDLHVPLGSIYYNKFYQGVNLSAACASC